jgi:DNA polymerase
MLLFKDHFKAQLNKKIKECKSCSLCSNSGPILGYGSLDADVMFIADAPEPKEARTGIPFIGKAKDKMLHAVTVNQLKKGEYYFTYLVKHSLGTAKTISTDTEQRCADLLLEEIELVNPRIIVSMGFSVTKQLIKHYNLKDLETLKLNDMHGNGYIVPDRKFYKGRYKKRQADRPKRYLIPTWSPCIDDFVMNDQFKLDIATVGAVRNLSILLYN